jgi:hypothetical protein
LLIFLVFIISFYLSVGLDEVVIIIWIYSDRYVVQKISAAIFIIWLTIFLLKCGSLAWVWVVCFCHDFSFDRMLTQTCTHCLNLAFLLLTTLIALVHWLTLTGLLIGIWFLVDLWLCLSASIFHNELRFKLLFKFLGALFVFLSLNNRRFCTSNQIWILQLFFFMSYSLLDLFVCILFLNKFHFFFINNKGLFSFDFLNSFSATLLS